MRFSSKAITTAIFLAGILFISISCATKKDVQAAVASTNEAIIDLLVDQPGLRLNAATDTNWRVPLAQIEQIIQANPDQPILVNHLRVRQAWLLTVYGQHNIANEVWKQVDPKSLQTEREANLYANRQALTWWMAKTQSGAVFIEDSETTLARVYAVRLDSSATAVDNHDLEAYFSTMSASVLLKLLSGAGAGTSMSLQQAAEEIPPALNGYISHFNAGERSCAAGDADAALTTPGAFRNCAYLKTIYTEFKAFSDRLIARGINVDVPPL